MNTVKILKLLCYILSFLGISDIWHEDDLRYKAFIKILGYIIYAVCIIFASMEILVIVFGEYPLLQMIQAKTLGITHAFILIKPLTIICQSKTVKNLNRDMIEYCHKHENTELYKKQYTQIKNTTILYCIIVYATISFYIINALNETIYLGESFIPFSTCWPSYNDDSLLASICRVIIMFMPITVCLSLITVDCFTMSHLIMLRFKYNTLIRYFRNIKDELDNDYFKSEDEKSENIYQKCLEGVKMHQQLLRLFRNIEKSLGLSMSIQVGLCSGSAVLVMLEVSVTKDINRGALGVSVFFMGALLVMLGVIVLNAGNLTYEASMLPDAIFQCGWHLSPLRKRPNNDIRELIILAITQAQSPVTMKAFGIINLSHSSYLAMVRTSYSVFAVIIKGTNKHAAL